MILNAWVKFRATTDNSEYYIIYFPPDPNSGSSDENKIFVTSHANTR
jgi:hypothetical protein